MLHINCTIAIKTWVWTLFNREVGHKSRSLIFWFQWDAPGHNTNRMYAGQGASTNMQQSQGQRWPAPGPIQRPSNSGSFSNPSMNYQNYQNSHYQQQQQRPVRNPVNSSMMTQGVKSQYFNPQTKRKEFSDRFELGEDNWFEDFPAKSDSDKGKPPSTIPTKAPDDPLV